MANKQAGSLRSVKTILATGRQAELFGQNRAHQRLLETVRELLPDNFRSHCISAQQAGNTLLVHTDTSTWATKLRFQLPGILPALQRQPDLHALNRCDIRILPRQLLEQSSPTHTRQIDKHIAQQIRELACVISDENLRKRWLKIAENDHPIIDQQDSSITD